MPVQLTQTNKKSNLSPAAEQSIFRKTEEDTLLTEQPQTDVALQMKSIFKASNGGAPLGSGDGDNTLNNSRLFDYLKVQPKLTIGTPNNKYEQEADKVADQVMRRLTTDSGSANGKPEQDDSMDRVIPLKNSFEQKGIIASQSQTDTSQDLARSIVFKGSSTENQDTLLGNQSNQNIPIIQRQDFATQVERVQGNVVESTSRNSIQRQLTPAQEASARERLTMQGPRRSSLVSRKLEFVEIKMNGTGIDHWWVEIDGTESYGWWPEDPDAGTCAYLGAGDGASGVLNATTRTVNPGTSTRDPHHGANVSSFYPVRVVSRGDEMTDDQIRSAIRSYANTFSGDYNLISGPSCHTFIIDLMHNLNLRMSRFGGYPSTSWSEAISDALLPVLGCR